MRISHTLRLHHTRTSGIPGMILSTHIIIIDQKHSNRCDALRRLMPSPLTIMTTLGLWAGC